jgi:hypothetical protein
MAGVLAVLVICTAAITAPTLCGPHHFRNSILGVAGPEAAGCLDVDADLIGLELGVCGLMSAILVEVLFDLGIFDTGVWMAWLVLEVTNHLLVGLRH